MLRIKLPGTLKTKKILLAILVAIACIILVKTGIENRNDKGKVKEIVEVQDKEEEGLNNEEAVENNEEEKNLYNDAFETFHSFNYSLAIEKANILLDKYPNSELGYNIRGIAKAYNGDFQGGMEDIDKALEINPSYDYALFNKALNYELYGQFDNALEWYNKALEVTQYEWSYYGIASIYGRRGDVENTVKYLAKAIELEPAVKEHAKEEVDFDPVRNSEEFQKLIK